MSLEAFAGQVLGSFIGMVLGIGLLLIAAAGINLYRNLQGRK